MCKCSENNHAKIKKKVMAIKNTLNKISNVEKYFTEGKGITEPGI